MADLMYGKCFIVLSNPVGGREDEYNEWYSHQHLSDLIKIPSIIGAQRFASADTDRSTRYPYLAIYELSDVQKTIDELTARRGTPLLVGSDALDRDRTMSFYAEAVSGAAAIDGPGETDSLYIECGSPAVSDAFREDTGARFRGSGHRQLLRASPIQSRANVPYTHAAIFSLTNADGSFIGESLKMGTSRDMSENSFAGVFRPITHRITKGAMA